MAGISYVPGTWLGIVRSRTAVLLGPDTPPALADALWTLLADTPEVHEVLHAVTSSSGGSLASIPSFGILDFTGPLRVFLRGELELTVALPDGTVELNGRDVTTWNERRFDMPGQCTLTIPDAASEGHRELPLGEGAVLLQSLTLALATGQAGAGSVQATVGAAALQGEVDAETAIEGHLEVEAEADALEMTVSPEHGVSAETVLEVIDDEADHNETDHDETDHDDAGFGGQPEMEGHAGHAPVSPTPQVSVTPLDASQSGTAEAGSTPGGVGSAQAETVAASDITGSYDHLWERTVIRNIEDAAVREDAEADEAAQASSRAPAEVAAQAPALEPAAQRAALEPADEGEVPGVPATSGDSASASGSGPLDGPGHRPGSGNGSESAARPAQAGTLIDSVPWRTGNPVSGQAQAQAQVGAHITATPIAAAHIAAPPAPPTTPTPSIPGTPPSAVPAPVAGTTPPEGTGWQGGAHPQAAVDFDGDHDGQTVMKGSLAGMVSHPAPAASPDPAAGPTVLARVCAEGHANPPTRAQCAACRAALLPDAVQVARPRLGRMRLSTGELLDLDQSLVIGRQPSVSRVQGGVMPRLVQVASPGGDISRSHVEVRLEGWHVMLCDLKATNGTVLVRDGQPPRRLAQNEMAILLDGDIAELGDNISLRFEEIL
jgi:hypothetical protein